MIHRAVYGSIERFMGVLLEHYKGLLPFWIAPVQIKVLPIADTQLPYTKQVAELLTNQGLRVELDESSDPLQGKIKSAQLEKIPWMLIIGQKEVDTGTITLRHRDGSQQMGLTIEQLLKKAQES